MPPSAAAARLYALGSDPAPRAPPEPPRWPWLGSARAYRPAPPCVAAPTPPARAVASAAHAAPARWQVQRARAAFAAPASPGATGSARLGLITPARAPKICRPLEVRRLSVVRVPPSRRPRASQRWKIGFGAGVRCVCVCSVVWCLPPYPRPPRQRERLVRATSGGRPAAIRMLAARCVTPCDPSTRELGARWLGASSASTSASTRAPPAASAAAAVLALQRRAAKARCGAQAEFQLRPTGSRRRVGVATRIRRAGAEFGICEPARALCQGLARAASAFDGRHRRSRARTFAESSAACTRSGATRNASDDAAPT